MEKQEVDHTAFLWIGLALTLAVIVALGVYSRSESARLAHAAEEFTAERIARGGQIYVEQCTSCHGAQGEGGVGPALNDRQVLKNTLDKVFFSVIRSGVPGTQMPAWSVEFGGPLTDEDIRDVVAYLRAWEPTAPEIQTEQFEPDPARGAVLFASTCVVCHGEAGQGTETAPRLNDLERLQALSDDWYRGVIENGRPAKGMPTWGTVLSPNQIADLVALLAAWREGRSVQPDFSATELLDLAYYALEQDDPASAALELERARSVLDGAGAQILQSALDQISAGDLEGAQANLETLRQQWPVGDPAAGTPTYSANCAACHGTQGEGGVGPALQSSEFVQSESNAGLVAFIQEGRPGTAMAGFGTRLNEGELADIVALLRLWQGQP